MKTIPRPTLEQTTEIARHVRDGYPLHLAAHLAEIDPELVVRWFTRGKAGQRPYGAFFEAIRDADADHTRALLATIVAAAGRGSKRAAGTLKRFRRGACPDRQARG